MHRNGTMNWLKLQATTFFHALTITTIAEIQPNGHMSVKIFTTFTAPTIYQKQRSSTKQSINGMLNAIGHQSATLSLRSHREAKMGISLKWFGGTIAMWDVLVRDGMRVERNTGTWFATTITEI